MDAFWNRTAELKRIKQALGKGQFGYVTGRRRIGKTALLRQACEQAGGIYYQAVEGTPQQQLYDLTLELQQHLDIFRDITPKNWNEFFRLLSQASLPKLLVLDEFPYWVDADPSLPSHLQKWIDHELPKHQTLLLVSGSSQTMLYSQFLKDSSPLFGRATLHLHLAPLSYSWFCRALDYKAEDPRSFERYTLVGGVPHYWKLMPKGSVTQQATSLFFDPSAPLAEEPRHILQDERVTGTLPKAILDLIGRGVSKPSEIAARLGDKQSNLSRPLALLLDLGLIHRELPFGESSRTTKRVHYQIQDPQMAFYYSTYLPNRSRWPLLSKQDQQNVLIPHLAKQWELFCRSLYPGSARYWERQVELDLVAPLNSAGQYLVAECKWSPLSQKKRESLLADLKRRFALTKLSRQLKKVSFNILSQECLEKLPMPKKSL